MEGAGVLNAWSPSPSSPHPSSPSSPWQCFPASQISIYFPSDVRRVTAPHSSYWGVCFCPEWAYTDSLLLWDVSAERQREKYHLWSFFIKHINYFNYTLEVFSPDEKQNWSKTLGIFHWEERILHETIFNLCSKHSVWGMYLFLKRNKQNLSHCCLKCCTRQEGSEAAQPWTLSWRGAAPAAQEQMPLLLFFLSGWD